MKKALQHFIRRIREGHLHGNARRNFRVLIVASVLNLSFALEKLTLVIGYPQKDIVWMGIYGCLALYLFSLAFVDLAKDMEQSEELRNQNIV